MNSKYFIRQEFACKCGCDFAAMDCELLNVLEMVRIHFGKPVIITSGCRCRKHNTYVTGNVDSKSMHIYGMAADIKVRGIKPEKVYNWLDRAFPNTYGLGNDKEFTHIDVRESKARWNYD